MSDKQGLREEDLTLLGGFYCTGVQPVFSETADGCQVSAGPIPFVSIAVMETVIISFFVGMWILIANRNPQALTPFIITGIVVAALLATLGPLVAHGLRIRELMAKSPLLSFDNRTQVISVLNGRRAFPNEHVQCLLLITESIGESSGAEVQLVVDNPDGRERLLIDSTFGNSFSLFHKTYVPFAEHTGLRLLTAKRQSTHLGWKTGDFVVSEVVAQTPSQK